LELPQFREVWKRFGFPLVKARISHPIKLIGGFGKLMAICFWKKSPLLSLAKEAAGIRPVLQERIDLFEQ
jgi:hypothetical protein